MAETWLILGALATGAFWILYAVLDAHGQRRPLPPVVQPPPVPVPSWVRDDIQRARGRHRKEIP